MTVALGISLAFAIIEWVAIAIDRRAWEYVAKPATMVFLILWYVMRSGLKAPFPAWAFAAGLVLSLAGDTFLILPSDPFLLGLVSFLLAHIAYIAALNAQGLLVTFPTLAIAGAIAMVAIWLVGEIRHSLLAKGKASLIPPVAVYAFFLALMLWSALAALFRPGWPPVAAWLIAVGGVLFFVSDALLAWNRFVASLWHGRVFVMVTYHLAQYALAAGMLLALG